jgi:hypothetical protein
VPRPPLPAFPGAASKVSNRRQLSEIAAEPHKIGNGFAPERLAERG